MTDNTFPPHRPQESFFKDLQRHAAEYKPHTIGKAGLAALRELLDYVDRLEADLLESESLRARAHRARKGDERRIQAAALLADRLLGELTR